MRKEYNRKTFAAIVITLLLSVWCLECKKEGSTTEEVIFPSGNIGITTRDGYGICIDTDTTITSNVSGASYIYTGEEWVSSGYPSNSTVIIDKPIHIRKNDVMIANNMFYRTSDGYGLHIDGDRVSIVGNVFRDVSE